MQVFTQWVFFPNFLLSCFRAKHNSTMVKSKGSISLLFNITNQGRKTWGSRGVVAPHFKTRGAQPPHFLALLVLFEK